MGITPRTLRDHKTANNTPQNRERRQLEAPHH
jgi:hypothetical protein